MRIGKVGTAPCVGQAQDSSVLVNGGMTGHRRSVDAHEGPEGTRHSSASGEIARTGAKATGGASGGVRSMAAAADRSSQPNCTGNSSSNWMPNGLELHERRGGMGCRLAGGL
jgi:hypothetical protein